MDLDAWWDVIETARKRAGDRADDRGPAGDPLVGHVIDLLARREPEEIVAFDRTLGEVTATAYRYPLWNAAYLIEGGCGDDGFMDFRAGLVLQGRERFTRAVADPDSLADVPIVVRMARDDDGWIGCEPFNYAAGEAYERRTGRSDAFQAAMEAALGERDIPDGPLRAAGDNWDPEDEAETRRRLPRLSALFLT